MMKLSFYLLFAVFISCALTKKERVYEVVENLSYSDKSQRTKGDLYLPKNQVVNPVVVLIHGGGWKRRGKEDMAPVAEDLASHGFAVYNIQYRLAPQHTYPAQLNDLKEALYFLKQNSEKYRLRSNSIALWGYSAGGHLASLVAVKGDLDEAGVNQLPIKAVVAGATPFDLTSYPDSDMIQDFLGASHQERPELYKEASPIKHLDNSDPDFFLYHGKNDWVVEIDQTKRFIEELEKNNIGYEFYSIPLLGHSTVFTLSGSAREKAIGFLKENLNP